MLGSDLTPQPNFGQSGPTSFERSELSKASYSWYKSKQDAEGSSRSWASSSSIDLSIHSAASTMPQLLPAAVRVPCELLDMSIEYLRLVMRSDHLISVFVLRDAASLTSRAEEVMHMSTILLQ